MEIKTDANTLASEALVNCWLREGGSFEISAPGLLRIPLAQKSETILVRFDDRTLLGDTRLTGAPLIGQREIAALELAEKLVAEMSRSNDTRSRLPSDWKTNVAHSAEMLDKILGLKSESSSLFDFIASEQSLVLGHRFHPSPKSRIGFTDADIENFSPEWHGRFRLHYLRVADELIVVRGDRAWAEKWSAAIKPICGAGWILPLHPWQASRALAEPEVRKALRHGLISDLGETGPEFHPTSSVRTLYQPEWDFFIKTSLRVRITNCFRENLPQEIETLAGLRDMLREFLPASDSFRLLDEPLSLDLGVGTAVHCGAIFREGLDAERQRGAEPLLAAALFGDRHFGVSRLQALLGPKCETALWFRRYCEGLVPPVLKAFFGRGIMLEPHLQNILLCPRPGGALAFLQRDLDNVKVVEGSEAARAIASAPASVRKECFYSQEIAWKRLVYCLIVNHLSESIASLARLDGRAGDEARNVERELWMILRDIIRAEFGDEPLARRLIDEPALWAKKNFLTRVTRTADREAPFASIPNPLNQARIGC